MKTLALAITALALSSNVMASESRTYKKVSATEASVTIKTEETDATQAASYNDGKENKKFISELLKDANSPVYKLAREIEMENCEATSTSEDPVVETCGEVTVTEDIRTSFERGGWQNSSSGYTFFLGFTNQGTGRFFGVSHMITIYEEAEALSNEEYEYSGVVMKHYSLGSIKKISDESTENSEK